MSSGRVYAGRTAEERALERREALLDAGLELFGTRPFTEVSVSAVIQLAKVTRRGFYEQFKDRVDLLRAVDERTRDGIAHLLAPLGDGIRTWDDAKRILTATHDFYEEDPRRIQVSFIAVIGVNQELEDYRRQAFRLFGEIMGEALGERAGSTPADRRRSTQAFFGASSELLSDWAWAKDEPLSAVRAELLELFRARFFKD